MMAAFDVHYSEQAVASAAAVLFHRYSDAAPADTCTHLHQGAADYVSGQFYKRELPCLLELIKRIRHPLDKMIIDGYVMHDDGPGLGKCLYTALGSRIPVIGVAKSEYRGACAVEVLRGKSRRPLFITAVGIDAMEAADRIRQMHGSHRIPTLLKMVDQLARTSAP